MKYVQNTHRFYVGGLHFFKTVKLFFNYSIKNNVHLFIRLSLRFVHKVEKYSNNNRYSGIQSK